MNPQEIRRANLALLIKHMGGQAAFIRKTGRNQGMVSHLLRDKPFGEKLARKIESECGLPAGALSKPAGVSADPMDDIKAALDAADWLTKSYRANIAALIESQRDKR